MLVPRKRQRIIESARSADEGLEVRRRTKRGTGPSIQSDVNQNLRLKAFERRELGGHDFGRKVGALDRRAMTVI